jgi:hypothetical protein
MCIRQLSAALASLGVTDSQEVAAEVFSHLDSPMKLSTGLPPAASTQDGVPRQGAGRGAAIDGENWQVQCGSVGAPMNQTH